MSKTAWASRCSVGPESRWRSSRDVCRGLRHAAPEELGIEECHQDGGAKKLPIVRELLEKRDLTWDAVAMMGDDLADIPLLERVGLPVAVANAVPEVHALARWTTSARGRIGGAVREFSRALLRARQEWESLVREYCDARSGA